jgi:hypothetical protein
MKNLYFLLMVLFSTVAFGNNILVQNVTTTGNNATNKTIQVQFDLSWENSWRDAINWDAAWVFMKFKNASGVWQHVQLNTTGFANGTGTANTMQVTSDKVGCWVYRSAQGSGTFNNTTMQLQWNYGLSGLTSVTGLEVRVYAVEMVYVPQGDFNCAKSFNNQTVAWATLRSFISSGNNFPVINNRLSPTIQYNDGNLISLKIKGDVGVDFDNNGIVENSNYPTGYKPFYAFKYELTEQQYSDFLNTLSSTQLSNLGVAGSGITMNNGLYFTSTPNKACGQSNATRLFAYADWSGLRPMSFLEFNKASYGPLQPLYVKQSPCYYGQRFLFDGYPAWGSSGSSYVLDVLSNVGSFTSSTSNRVQSGSSYYGLLDLTGNAHEPVIRLINSSFGIINGNGQLDISGNSDISSWSSTVLTFIDMIVNYDCSFGTSSYFSTSKYGFRYVRSAE